MRVKDGTGSCWIGLHHIHYKIRQKVKIYKADEILPLLEGQNIGDISREQIEDAQHIRVIEKWIPMGHEVTFYGTYNKLSTKEIPSDLIKAADKSRKLGVDNDEMQRDPIRQMREQDWQKLISEAISEGRSTIDILTTDYTGNEEKEITMGLKDHSKINYGAIGLYVAAMGFILVICYAFLRSEFPEFIETVRLLFN